jgi:hypothetical protein
MADAWLTQARTEFHSTILAGILTKNDKGVPSNADTGSNISVAIATAILDQLGVARTAAKLPGQTAGADFEEVTATFVRLCFEHLSHLRPGNFFVTKGGGIAQFEQYAHLDELEAIAKSNRAIATALGADYLIKPDIVVGRYPENDAVINFREA